MESSILEEYTPSFRWSNQVIISIFRILADSLEIYSNLKLWSPISSTGNREWKKI